MEAATKIFPHRRRFMHLAAGAAALPAASLIARARNLIRHGQCAAWRGLSSGSHSRRCSRLMGRWLSEHLAQPVIVENRPGAGTNLAAEVVVRAPADGHTLLLTTTRSCHGPE